MDISPWQHLTSHCETIAYELLCSSCVLRGTDGKSFLHCREKFVGEGYNL